MKRDRDIAKFWLEPIELARNLGFGSNEVARIEELVREYRDLLIEAWHDYFDA